DAYTVGAIPTVSSVTPAFDGNHLNATWLTVRGTRFQPGASVLLRLPGSDDLVGSQVVIDADGATLTARIAIGNAAAGRWDVVVRNPGGFDASLPRAFELRIGPRIG